MIIESKSREKKRETIDSKRTAEHSPLFPSADVGFIKWTKREPLVNGNLASVGSCV